VTESAEIVRVIVADDHPMFREGLSALFEAVPDVALVAECASGAAAIEAAAAHQPDVVIMDLQMPGMSGIDATRQIVGTSPHIGVLVVTMFDEDESVFAAMRAGARGYVLKGAGHDEILRAVRTVAAGEAIFGSALARRLIGYFSGSGGASTVPFGNLTAREREVLDKVAAGRSNTGIARDLGLSEKTVRNHLSNIFVKLQVADRAQAIVRAREAGMGVLPGAPPPR
jgi:DNA-binding NarL/FixJ family response regulator